MLLWGRLETKQSRAGGTERGEIFSEKRHRDRHYAGSNSAIAVGGLNHCCLARLHSFDSATIRTYVPAAVVMTIRQQAKRGWRYDRGRVVGSLGPIDHGNGRTRSGWLHA